MLHKIRTMLFTNNWTTRFTYLKCFLPWSFFCWKTERCSSTISLWPSWWIAVRCAITLIYILPLRFITWCRNNIDKNQLFHSSYHLRHKIYLLHKQNSTCLLQIFVVFSSQSKLLSSCINWKLTCLITVIGLVSAS